MGFRRYLYARNVLGTGKETFLDFSLLFLDDFRTPFA